LDRGETVIVRFAHGLEECAKAEVERVLTPLQALDEPEWHVPLEVVTRIQAEAIVSVNDVWGVLSRSRIALLPHQLWVCKRVLEQWPSRWLIADDVGLGKTIEAGLILWPLISGGRAQRVLVLCPAHLVQHWQYRLRKLFDIRLSPYSTELDTAAAEWFASNDRVVASLDTLARWLSAKTSSRRIRMPERLNRLLSSPPWDVLIVDEAHHLNYDESAGPTLAFRLVRELLERDLVRSALFFTGTPHRGKDYAFSALCGLLRPDLFQPEVPLRPQLPRLREMMIRNNKHAVTDIEGHPLFTKPQVEDNTYRYSPEEAAFYRLLTEFVSSGRAYASELQERDGRAVMLVLYAIQKLASSSVAAIRRALRKRLARIRETDEALGEARRRLGDYEEAELDPDLLDRVSELEEEIASLTASLSLMQDEAPRLRELLDAAERITDETKIASLIELVERRFSGRQVLFFTEYKATQSLVMSALISRFGAECVTFINGDDRAEEVRLPDGRQVTRRETRAEAAERFNSGQVRFLVSTEAGGEGIDLQESCWTLVHVDLPWNPMRMHQRVGRLNRYGQRHQVDVVIIRNSETVESAVWEKLNEKIMRITAAFSHTMEAPEDLLELILGMTSPTLFRDLYGEASAVPRESFSEWFDRRTAQFGGHDVVDTVRALVGNAARFDYGAASSRIPRIDLPDLRSFVLAMVRLNERGYHLDGDSISFKTPKEWQSRLGVRPEYSGMVFDRGDRSERAEERILGVGHPVVDEALKQARASRGSLTVIPEDELTTPLAVFRVTDRATTGSGPVRSVVVGALREESGGWSVLEDWRLLQRANAIADRHRVREAPAPTRPRDAEGVGAFAADAQQVVRSRIPDLDLPFAFPEPALLAVLWPCAGSE